MNDSNLTMELDAHLMYTLKEISIKVGTNCAYLINALLYNIATSFKTSKVFKGMNFMPSSSEKKKKNIRTNPDVLKTLKLLALKNGTTLTTFLNVTLQKLVDVPYSGDTDEELANDFYIRLTSEYREKEIIDLLKDKQK